MTGVDTNILFYAIDNSDERKHRISIKIIEDIIRNPRNYKISLQAIAELNHAVARKNKNAAKLASELSEALLAFSDMIVHYSEKELRLAIIENRMFDALLAYTYATSGCNEVCTENIKDMPKLKGMKFINPFL